MPRFLFLSIFRFNFLIYYNKIFLYIFCFLFLFFGIYAAIVPRALFAAVCIKVTGMGKFPPGKVHNSRVILRAQRAAMVHGYRQILQEHCTLSSSLQRSSQRMNFTRRKGFLRGVEVLEIRVLKKGFVQVDMALSYADTRRDICIDKRQQCIDADDIVQRKPESYEISEEEWIRLHSR